MCFDAINTVSLLLFPPSSLWVCCLDIVYYSSFSGLFYDFPLLNFLGFASNGRLSVTLFYKSVAGASNPAFASSTKIRLSLPTLFLHHLSYPVVANLCFCYWQHQDIRIYPVLCLLSLLKTTLCRQPSPYLGLHLLLGIIVQFLKYDNRYVL